MPRFETGDQLSGYASWYGAQFHGRKTASGEVYNMHEFTAAHRTAPFGTRIKVTNLDNQQSTEVRVNDRGPFVRGRIIDLSHAAAKAIGMLGTGTAAVRLDILGKVATSSSDQFYVQIGAYKERQNAETAALKFKTRHPEVSVEIIPTENLRRVWVGPFSTEEKANDFDRILQNEGFDSIVLRR